MTQTFRGAVRARRLIVLEIALLCSAGCSVYPNEPWPPRVYPATGEMRGDHACINLFYATDRDVTGSPKPAEFYGAGRTRMLQYGQCEVTIPPDHVRGRCEEPGIGGPSPSRDVLLTELTPSASKAEFIAALRKRVALSKRHEVFVFVHGFTVTFKESMRKTAQLVHDIDADAVPFAYSWPAQGSILSYLVDTGNAEWSAVYLADVLDILANDCGAEHVHIVAHSMGTQVLARAIKEYAAQHPVGDRPPFDQIILAAADMDSEIFERDYLPSLLRYSRRLTIYMSNADFALFSSATLHKYGRLGQTGAPNIDIETLKRLDMVDVTDCDRGLIGHAYYSESPMVLKDIGAALKGEPAGKRGLQQRFFYYMENAK